jgi:tetratricopeptide (TPR) repeat protein
MPPWKPEPGYGDFVGARRLTEDEIGVIQRWAGAGAPRGELSDLPPAPTAADGWRLGQPDLVVMTEPFTLPAGGVDVLRNFVVAIPTPATRYVAALEFRPGNARVVHHANIRVDRTRTARRLDASDPQPGFDGFIAAGSFPDGHFLGWTPGQLRPPETGGMSWRLEPESDLVLQLHMQPSGAETTVQAAVGLFFTDTPPGRMPFMIRLGRHDIDIPPGAARYTIEDRYTLPVDVDTFAVQPHAHYRATEVRGYAILPDGARRWLLYIRDWDFNWQDTYRFTAPIALPKGTTLTMEFTYDNSAANRRNPDRPPRRVRWGENSSDEMGNLWIQVVPRTSADRAALATDFGPKVMADDAAGYRTRLEADPGSGRLHEAIAAIELGLGRTGTAITHLNEAVRINPRSVEAHYNLGVASARQRRTDDAIAHFEAATRLDPTHAAAHANLGAVLRLAGRAGAAEALRRALQLDPANPTAHANLAGILASRGEAGEAVEHYRLALRTDGDLLEPLTELAWILATSPDPSLRNVAEAVTLARRAVELTGGTSVRALDTIAAAYGAAGNLAGAAAALKSAIELAEAAGDVQSARQLRIKLDSLSRK